MTEIEKKFDDYLKESKKELSSSLNPFDCFKAGYEIALTQRQSLPIDSVGESTYPKEFVHLAKGNYLDKDGSIKEAQTMRDHLGNEYFMVAKDKLYYR